LDGATMRLAEFILENVEPILAEWEVFARGITPGTLMDPAALRDHAADILRATALDMRSAQTDLQRSDKSKGDGDATGRASRRVDGASDIHARGRVESGFDMMQMVAEYRALRASVVRLWRDSKPDPDQRDIDDITRFNESIDQSLTGAIESYTQRVDRSRQMFLAILGHDLRNPLNSINMSAQVLAGSGGLSADDAELARGMSASASAMARMIGDLLDFTGAGLGAAMPITVAATDLGTLCGEVLDEMRSAYPQRTLRFHAQGNLSGHWDRARLRQVVSNLLGNAIQHGSDDGPVELSVRGSGDEVVLSVRNGGEPIPEELVPTIFDPLVRAPASPALQRHRRPGSIGLGLYIARAVVTAHGGSIDVTSSATDGTVFTARLPRGVRADR
jgi:signal transduction histidine kinase